MNTIPVIEGTDSRYYSIIVIPKNLVRTHIIITGADQKEYMLLQR
jgi:hypothetical protein